MLLLLALLRQLAPVTTPAAQRLDFSIKNWQKYLLEVESLMSWMKTILVIAFTVSVDLRHFQAPRETLMLIVVHQVVHQIAGVAIQTCATNPKLQALGIRKETLTSTCLTTTPRPYMYQAVQLSTIQTTGITKDPRRLTSMSECIHSMHASLERTVLTAADGTTPTTRGAHRQVVAGLTILTMGTDTEEFLWTTCW